MKKLVKIAVAATVATLALGTYVSGPYRAANNALDAVAKRDHSALENTFNFDNLRGQIKTEVLAKTMADLHAQNNPYASVGSLLGKAMVESIVDATITPEGLITMLGKDTVSRDNSHMEIKWTSYNRAAICHKTEKVCVLELAPKNPFAWQVNGFSPDFLVRMRSEG